MTNPKIKMTKQNVLDKIKSGFYWYNKSFETWKELMIIDENDTEKIKIFSDYVFSRMNIMTSFMVVSSKEWQKEYATRKDLRDKVFKEQIVKRILNIAKNKKFEWEDEELTETYNITYDFDEWFSITEETERKYYEVSETFYADLLKYSNQLKDYVDAFLLGSVGMYKGKVIEAKSVSSHTSDFNEVVEFVKELKQNNKMVFLYCIEENKSRPKDIEIDGVIYPQDLSVYYKVRYGVLND